LVISENYSFFSKQEPKQTQLGMFSELFPCIEKGLEVQDRGLFLLEIVPLEK